MNTDTGNTDTEAHLDLEDLLAGAAGEPLGEQARSHLAACPDCRAELARWGTVAGGTQLLVAATDVPPWRFTAGRTGPRGRRRALITAAAAAAVLAAGGTTWGVISSSAHGPAATMAGLTAVTGCPGLIVTSGTLERIDGSQLMVRSLDGHDVTITTSRSTTVSAEVPGSLRDITDGARVLVHGTLHGTTLAARNIGVNLMPVLNQPRIAPRAPQGERLELPAMTAAGSVLEVHAGGFTVGEPLGPQLHITTSPATVVDTLALGSLGRLRTGVHVIAVGQSGPDGTLAAATLEQGADLPGVEVPLSRSATGTCAPSGVASTLALGG